MTPASPVFPSMVTPEVVYAKDQPEYIPLPSYRTDDGEVITRWKLSFFERLRVLATGNIWHHQLTFNRKLQPIKMVTISPIQKRGRAE